METVSFYCKGHPNILATHKSTIEITTDTNLSLRGNCIIGVESSLSLNQLSDNLKCMLRNNENLVQIVLNYKDMKEIITGKGHPDLLLADSYAMILRKSKFVCSRTLMIDSDKAAKDISRKFIDQIKNSDSTFYVTINVYDGTKINSRQA